jgi:hypothetical protein
MERIHPTHLHPVADTSERTLLDIVAAIELVAAGGARRVVLSSLPDPELVAVEALAHAQAAGVRFSLSRGPEGGLPAVVVGPVEA